ncbi:MAG: hypothetical protein MUF21_00700 [Gemmatimonadaceae bacterium]|jgi:hypothetical protein|nr:hypothetical protein [Gemmatimonadaceae bacterium]
MNGTPARVALQLAERSAVLWELRARRVEAEETTLAELLDVDDELASALDALAADPRCDHAIAELAEVAADLPSTLFVLAATRWLRGLEVTERTGAAVGSPAPMDAVMATALHDAAVWVGSETASRGVASLAAEGLHAPVRAAAIRALGALARDPSPVVRRALADRSPECRLAAYDVVATRRLAISAIAVATGMDDPDRDVRATATRAAASVGDIPRVREAIARASATGDDAWLLAVRELVALLPDRESEAIVRGVAESAHTTVARRRVAELIGWAGHTRLLAVLDTDRTPEDAVGSVLARRTIWGDDAPLPPASGDRRLLGRPRTCETMVEILSEASQPYRRIAVWALAGLAPHAPVLDVSAPAWRQRRMLALLRVNATGRD